MASGKCVGGVGRGALTLSAPSHRSAISRAYGSFSWRVASDDVASVGVRAAVAGRDGGGCIDRAEDLRPDSCESSGPPDGRVRDGL